MLKRSGCRVWGKSMRDRQFISRFVVVVILLYSIFSFARARIELAEMERREKSLAAETAELVREHDELQARLEAETSDEYIEQLARQRLGLVMPGEKVFYFYTDREENGWDLK